MGSRPRRAERAVVDVLWPGVTRNRFYLSAGARATLPEIPCSFDDSDLTFAAYLGCVAGALDDLEAAGIVRRGRATRLLLQAVRAWAGVH